MRVIRSILSFTALVGVASCSGQSPEPSSSAPPTIGAAIAPIGYFKGSVDTAGTLTFETTKTDGLQPENVVATGTTPGTVTMHTVPGTVFFGLPNCSTALTLCGHVQLINHFTTASQGLSAIIDTVSLTGTTNTGPWDYGTVAGSGTSGTLTWAFHLPSSTQFSFTGHLNGVVPPAYISYDNESALRTGSQNYSQGFGMDFTVNSSITVTAVGAYDSNAAAGTGFASPVTVTIWNRSGPSIVPGLQVTLSGTNQTLIGGQRFASVTPVVLSPGNYSVVSIGPSGYELWNSSGAPGGANTTSAGGSGQVTYTGLGRNSAPNANTFPTNSDSGPANRYSAGTFIFQ